jgi:autoinducer 2-degrading protein
MAYIDVKPESIEAFKKITVYNHENSLKEAGNIRFDVLQNTEDETKFALYEIWKDEDAFASHKATEHYNKWAKEIESYIKNPRSRNTYTGIAVTGCK